MNYRKILMGATIFLALQTTAQSVDLSLIPYRQGDKWGYSNAEQKIVIAPKYAEAGWFSEGFAAVKVGNKYGYINKSGKLVIPAKFTVAKSFRKGYVPTNNTAGGDTVLFAGASLRTDGYEVCINTKGQTMPKCPAMPESAALENQIPVATVVSQKNYSLPNNNGLFDKIVDDYKIRDNDETYYIGVKNEMYGVFNSKLDTIVPFMYNSITVNRAGKQPFLQVSRNGMHGILLANGTTAIEADNERLSTVFTKDGVDYAIVKRNGKTYVRGLDNKDLIAQGYNDIIYDPIGGGFVLVGENESKGYFFPDAVTISPKYRDVQLVDGTRFLQVRTSNGKVGYINSAGNEYFVE